MSTWRCWFRHLWRVHQHNITTDGIRPPTIVIAWKQCERCAASKLIHILE